MPRVITSLLIKVTLKWRSITTDKEFAIEQGLRDIYYEPKTGYRSAEKLYQKAKEDGLKVS